MACALIWYTLLNTGDSSREYLKENIARKDI
jgi:hypothetical protein